MNKGSNTYTIIYSIVLVVIVGVALSLVYQCLHPRQEENAANEKRKQILAAACISTSPGENITELYNSHITDSFLVNSQGAEVKGSIDAFDVDVAKQLEVDAQERQLPVFVCQTDRGVKYILPVYGSGLWGPIWGYIAFDDNGDTIYGAYFGHQGETPGLGAEIEKPKFSNQFKGKDVFSKDGNFESVAVVKNGMEPKNKVYVHAVSGGTVTSTGVSKMLYESLLPYAAFLRKLKSEKAEE